MYIYSKSVTIFKENSKDHRHKILAIYFLLKSKALNILIFHITSDIIINLILFIEYSNTFYL